MAPFSELDGEGAVEPFERVRPTNPWHRRRCVADPHEEGIVRHGQQPGLQPQHQRGLAAGGDGVGRPEAALPDCLVLVRLRPAAVLPVAVLPVVRPFDVVVDDLHAREYSIFGLDRRREQRGGIPHCRELVGKTFIFRLC